ncbi:uncharacterized protein OCT59_015427 [Rhizophagus irregularis]|uniref:Uncharacterized protein n=1 Tax=Rhizophagus irregularis TaxID=588596 RepID=A0A915ZVX4_9GLOM|nr:hypothetical protein OCT59_015427 [Rhizophagus irregularis]CAB5389457.1 unnamed protein product [Rhizophagus irregularis]
MKKTSFEVKLLKLTDQRVQLQGTCNVNTPAPHLGACQKLRDLVVLELSSNVERVEVEIKNVEAKLEGVEESRKKRQIELLDSKIIVL